MSMATLVGTGVPAGWAESSLIHETAARAAPSSSLEARPSANRSATSTASPSLGSGRRSQATRQHPQAYRRSFRRPAFVRDNLRARRASIIHCEHPVQVSHCASVILLPSQPTQEEVYDPT